MDFHTRGTHLEGRVAEDAMRLRSEVVRCSCTASLDAASHAEENRFAAPERVFDSCGGVRKLMCGLVGLLCFEDAKDRVAPDVLDRMRDSLAHRGPDGAGSWIATDARVGLGHRRLSIIDLSGAANQPMSNEDGSVWIAFNGEIYNHAAIRTELEQIGGHRWKTDHSDTEVIIHAFEQWGIDCIHRFRGMFAFAIWDGRARELWLVRDRIGIKPLYYRIDNGTIVFASEIKAILEFPGIRRQLDEESLFYYLSFLTVPAPRTLFAGVRKLGAATWLRVKSDGTVSEHKYWDVLDHTESLSSDNDDAIADQVLAELREAVRLRTVSDVPVGAFLSGGIDSSANVALLAEGVTTAIKTFTVGFKEQTSYHNETDEARRIADMFHAEYHEQLLGVDDLIDFLPRMVELQDEPIADPVCVPLNYLARLARRNGVTVCQVGEGADELFIGYPGWRTIHFLEAFGHGVPRALKKLGLTGLALAGRRKTREYEFLNRSDTGVPIFWSGAEAFTTLEKTALFNDRLSRRFRGMTGWDALAPIYKRFHETARSPSQLNWMSYADLNLRLPELLLMRVDKMSMGEAVECRVPFLDHRFVELAMSIPERVKFRHARPKALLKRAVGGILPQDVINRRKQGFGVPIEEWLLRHLGVRARAAVLEFARESELFDEQEVIRMLDRGRASRTWFLLNLSLWWKRFIA